MSVHPLELVQSCHVKLSWTASHLSERNPTATAPNTPPPDSSLIRSPKKRFSFRLVTLDCTGKRFSDRKGKRKHENKIVCRRPCCERDHDCSSEPRRCSRSDGGISRRRSWTQRHGCSRSHAARRCFTVPLTSDAVIRQ